MFPIENLAISIDFSPFIFAQGWFNFFHWLSTSDWNRLGPRASFARNALRLCRYTCHQLERVSRHFILFVIFPIGVIILCYRQSIATFYLSGNTCWRLSAEPVFTKDIRCYLDTTPFNFETSISSTVNLRWLVWLAGLNTWELSLAIVSQSQFFSLLSALKAFALPLRNNPSSL